MILVISHEGDVHSRAVWELLQARGANPALLDLQRFPGLAAIELSYGPNQQPAMRLMDQDWGEIDLHQVRCAWWRRPQPFGIPSEVSDPVHRSFALGEAREVFGGLWNLLDANWVNDPHRDDAAHRKSFQLRVAEQIGFLIPDTLITNSPERARDFISPNGSGRKTICKAFSGTPQAWRETRVVGSEELEQLDLVRLAPVIFQRYVDGVDIRVTVVADHIFPAEIQIQGDYSADFRMNYDHLQIRPTQLPPALEQCIRGLMQRLGLVYGALDFRRTADGDYFFLEINPAGQWLFIEQHTRQRITEAMASTLMGLDVR